MKIWNKIKKRFKAFKKYFATWRKYFCVYMCFVVLMVFIQNLFSCLNLPIELYESAKEGIKDIDLTDIYYNVSDMRDKDIKQNSKKNVVLINIGDIRNDSLRIVMPTLLEHLGKYKPRAIGIDILFEKSIPSVDTILINSIKKNHSIVISRTSKDILFGDDQDLDGIKQGIINFPEANKRTIRNYYAYATNIQLDTILYSFANQLAGDTLFSKTKEEESFFLKYSSSEIGYYNYLKLANKEHDTIDFPAVESNDLLNEKYVQKWDSLFNDKIVIIGQLGKGSMKYDKFNTQDKFKVPVSFDLFDRDYTMPGMVVHANAVQMLINQKKFNHKFQDISGFVFYTILFGVLFLYYLMFLWVEKIKNILGNLITESILIIAMTLFFIGISARLMVCNYHLKLDVLLIYLPILIEYKLFFYEMLHHNKYEEVLEKYYSIFKKIRK